MEKKLVGFADCKPIDKEIIDKKVNHYMRVFEKKFGPFDELNLTLKEIHSNENPVFHVTANAVAGAKVFHAVKEDRNVTKVVEESLRAIEEQLNLN